MGSEVEQTSCAAVESPDVHLFSLLDLTSTFVCMGFDGTQPPMQGIPSLLAWEQRRGKPFVSSGKRERNVVAHTCISALGGLRRRMHV